MGQELGPTVALLFALGLLASGFASTSVGAYAGGVDHGWAAEAPDPAAGAAAHRPRAGAGSGGSRNRSEPGADAFAGGALVRNSVRR
ncbi:Manganese transport protein MntH [Rhodococcus aetherivorans]|nr:Manganese transport protein MntH [Rhodococcus aetherivorans]